MADETAGAGNSGAATGTGSSFNLIGQYIRDLSFENPGAPASILAGAGQPTFSVNINVAVKKQADDVYAVELALNAKADRDKAVLFNVELIFGGVFRVRNIPEDQLAPLLMVECPRLIFPFARQVLANVVQQGGFPPLMMEPVDFQALYIQNLRALQAQRQQAAGAGDKPEAPAASAPDGEKPN
ncbi:protein-export chaperone SecB [Devosia sp.]|uniref:protein-export chaperone SecB n=1 Tax=Devosia sp. TaxID=1871048 RepID=UPI002EF2DC83